MKALSEKINIRLVSGQKKTLELFHRMAASVPAYKDFLHSNSIDHNKVETFSDLSVVPAVDKKNYLRKYELKDLIWDGNLFYDRLISVSSGSSGEPFFWPRGKEQDAEAGEIYEKLYRDIFEIDKYSTLFVICFSMGTWVAGSYTTNGTLAVAEKGYKIHAITPALEKEEAIKSILKIGDKYDQIVLAGYPPFIKDLMDDGEKSGIDWKKLNTRFSFAGESFTEQWRDHIVDRVKTNNFLKSSVNIYGSADAGVLGFESPLSIALRRSYDIHKELMKKIIGTEMLPSFIQYNPEQRYFELLDGELVFSANAGIPLIKYNIHDAGDILDFGDLYHPVADELKLILNKDHVNINDWDYPILLLYGRKDFTVTIYAVNIYPENIKAALDDERIFEKITGKFTMATKNESNMDQYFEINLELKDGIVLTKADEKLVLQVVTDKLKELNAEFRKLYAAVGDKALPRINYISGNEITGNKHRWVER